MADAILLPGILLPADLRYAGLLVHLGDRRTTLKDLEVYAGDQPPPDYSLDTEVEGLGRYADERGLDRFHLFGHSGGGAVAIAYVAAHPDRVLSLAVDEPASDFTPEDRALLAEDRIERFAELPPAERMAAFVRTMVRPGVTVAPAPVTAPAAEMAKRPAGVLAFAEALLAHDVPADRLAAYDGAVYFSYGSLSSARWEAMAERAPRLFRHCTVERYEGLHHMNTSHIAEPARVAAVLREMWA